MTGLNSKTFLWEIHKFGGSSLANASLFKKVANILIKNKVSKQACVVSAIYGVTDLLSKASDLAKKKSHQNIFESIRQKHFDIIDELLEKPFREEIKETLLSDFKALEYIFKTIELTQFCSENIREVITGHGEIWSAQILNSYLKQNKLKGQWVNARDVLFISSNQTPLKVDWEKSQKHLHEKIKDFDEGVLVLTGFIASTVEGVPTTLKRNGSDISASLFGNLLSASSITIWSDVDGIMNANPKHVPKAEVLKQVSYDEAMELAYFGASIIHPHTLAPAVLKKIPIKIRNTVNENHPGTLIIESSQKLKSDKIIKGVSNIDEMAIVNVEGTNMIGVPGMAQRIFGPLKDEGISVVLISQASSEHSICFCVPLVQAEQSKKTIEKEFYRELSEHQINSVSVIGPCSILAVVGENMINTPGVASKFFRALGNARVNVRGIAQGSSERNISAVIDQKDVKRAVKAVHAGFYLSPQTLSIGLVGPGLIGKAIIDQLKKQKDLLKEKFNFDFRVRGICNSRKMLLEDDQIELKDWETIFEEKAQAIDSEAFIDHLQTDEIPFTCLIDCTADEKIAQTYPQWIKKGIHIITPNKKANSLDFSLYQEIQSQLKKHRVNYFYEATVGAGLPIISTLKDLIQTGDDIIHIEGVFSGTLSYIFNNFSKKQTFSNIVTQAKEKGYTEPDPREDLSGMDVARKAIILAREMGEQINIEDVDIENLVPASLRDCGSIDDFMGQLAQFDREFEQKRMNAEKEQTALKYVATINPKKGIKVELKSYPLDHPFNRIEHSDNIILFKTKRYFERPLIVQGPGAGPEVTAAGIFSDLIRLANVLGKDK